MVTQVADRIPAEGADRDHDHHRHQRRHGNLPDPVAGKHHQHQQHTAGHKARQAGATTGFHVDHRLTDHGAARHAAKQARCDIRYTLALALTVLVTAGIGQIVDNRGSHHRLKQPNHRHRGRVRQNDHQRIEVEWHVRPEEDRQGIGQLAHITDSANIQPEIDRYSGQQQNAHQWRGNNLADARQQGEQIDDTQAGGSHGVNVPGYASQLGQLGHKNQDRQRVDKPGHHRARNEAHQRAEPQITGADLQHTAQHGSGQQVLQAVLANQGNHQQCHRPGCRRNHARTTAGKCDHHRNTKRGIQANLGIHSGDDGEGDGLRDQRQGNDQAGQQVAAHVGEPFAAQGFDDSHGQANLFSIQQTTPQRRQGAGPPVHMRQHNVTCPAKSPKARGQGSRVNRGREL